MASAAATAFCSATVLLLAMAIFTSGASSSEPLTTVQATDRASDGEKSNLLPVNQGAGNDEEKIKVGKRQEDDAGEAVSLASTEEGKKVGSGWAKAKKLDDDKGDSDSNSDHDHGSDLSSDSDSDSNSDSDDDSDADNSRRGKKEAPGGKHDDLFMNQ